MQTFFPPLPTTFHDACKSVLNPRSSRFDGSSIGGRASLGGTFIAIACPYTECRPAKPRSPIRQTARGDGKRGENLNKSLPPVMSTWDMPGFGSGRESHVKWRSISGHAANFIIIQDNIWSSPFRLNFKWERFSGGMVLKLLVN